MSGTTSEVQYHSATPPEGPWCDEDGVDWLDARHWVRGPNDELAIRNGCWFDAERAAWACYWMETQLSLYQAPFEGQPIRFLTCADDPVYYDELLDIELQWDVPAAWEEALPFYMDRMRYHNRMYAEGRFMHWHGEAVFQVYGWVRHSQDSRPHFRDRSTGKGKVVRRFREADVWCAKKNGKSPFTSANGLYLLCGDGEGGAQVGFGASDLGQAKKTIGENAFKMAGTSASLAEECKPNQNDCSLTYARRNGRMFPLSAGNVRTAGAQHGLNLSGGIIDEAHVCGRVVYDRFHRAFRSRLEPILWIVSTAGDNPESWGKERFDRARDILSGKIVDEETYVAMHAAPQEATDEDIEAHIVKYIHMANPALNHIVGLEQTLRDYDQSKNNPHDLAVFKYEILNIWVNTSVSWLPPGAYASCGGWRITAEDVGNRCVVSFDNAGTVDLACAVFTWECRSDAADLDEQALVARAAEHVSDGSDGREPVTLDQAIEIEMGIERRACIQHPIFWTNRKRLDDLAKLVPKMQEWEDGGYIRVCPGNANSNLLIARELRAEIQRFNVVGFVYDQWHSDPIVEYLTQGIRGPDGNLVYEPVLSPEQCVRMDQGTGTQASPTANFEADLNRKLVLHQDHPVLTWQFNHATVRADRNGNIKVEKETRKSFRSVDGVQACIMGRWGLLECDEFGQTLLNYYERNPLRSL